MAWLFVVSLANILKLCEPSDKLDKLKRATPDDGVAV